MNQKEYSQQVPNSQKGWDYIFRIAADIVTKHGGKVSISRPTDTLKDSIDDMGDTPDIWRNIDNVRVARTVSRDMGSGKSRRDRSSITDGNMTLAKRGMHYAPSRLIGKYCRIFSDQIRRPTSIQVEVFDPEVREKDQFNKFRMLAKVDAANNPKFRQAMELAGTPEMADMRPGEPRDFGEWKVWATGIYKNDQSRSIEILVDTALMVNDYENAIRPMLAAELRDAGVAVLMPYLDQSGRPRVELIPYEHCILPDTTDNWQSMQLGGVCREMTMERIVMEGGGRIPADVLKSMAEQAGGNRFHTWRVWTVYFIDHLEETRGTDGEGLRVILPEGASRDGYTDVKTYTYEVCFEARLLDAGNIKREGTDGMKDWERRFICLHAGLHEDQVRYRDSMRFTRIPLIARAVNMNSMSVRSLTQVLMDMMEPFESLWFQLKKLIPKIIPPGPHFSVAVIQAAIEADGKPWNLKKHLMLFKEEGVSFEKQATMDDPDGNRGASRGVGMNQGVIPEFERIISAMVGILNFVEGAVGFNDATAGKTVAERTAVRTAQMMAAGTQSSITPWTEAMDSIELELFRRMYGCWQNTYRSGRGARLFRQMFGDAVERNVELTIDNDPVSVGISLQIGAKESELADLRAMMQADVAANPGVLSAGDQLEVLRIARRNVALAAQVLSEKVRKNTDDMRKHEMEKIQLDQQKVAMADEAQTRRMQQQQQLDFDLKMQLAQFMEQSKAEIEASRQEHAMSLAEFNGQVQAMLQGEELDSSEREVETMARSAEEVQRDKSRSAERVASEKGRVSERIAGIAAAARERAAKKPPVGKKK